MMGFTQEQRDAEVVNRWQADAADGDWLYIYSECEIEAVINVLLRQMDSLKTLITSAIEQFDGEAQALEEDTYSEQFAYGEASGWRKAADVLRNALDGIKV